MKNKFFSLALDKATQVAGRRERLLLLLVRLSSKLRNNRWKNVHADTFKSNMYTLGRLSKAYALGHYKDLSWKNILLVVAAIIYFINPFDLIPDIVPVLGFTDDFSVLVWVYTTLNAEIDKFLMWEKAHPQLP